MSLSAPTGFTEAQDLDLPVLGGSIELADVYAGVVLDEGRAKV